MEYSEDWQEGTHMCLLKDHVRKFQDGMQKKKKMLVNWKRKMPHMVHATEVVLPLASFHGPVGVMALFSS